MSVELTDLLKELIRKEFELPPCACVNGLGELVILYEDCSYVEVPVAQGKFSLLKDLHDPRKIVGVIIPCFRNLALAHITSRSAN